MGNINQQRETNSNGNPSPPNSGQETTKSKDNRRTVDENGQRINWDNPEISEADNTEGRNPEIPHQEKGPGQTDEKEISDDPNVRKYYDQDPNVSTIRSSNADKTFGDEHKYDEQEGTKDLSGDQSDYTSNTDDSDEDENAKNEGIEGDNES